MCPFRSSSICHLLPKIKESVRFTHIDNGMIIVDHNRLLKSIRRMLPRETIWLNWQNNQQAGGIYPYGSSSSGFILSLRTGILLAHMGI